MDHISYPTPVFYLECLNFHRSIKFENAILFEALLLLYNFAPLYLVSR